MPKPKSWIDTSCYTCQKRKEGDFTFVLILPTPTELLFLLLRRKQLLVAVIV